VAQPRFVHRLALGWATFVLHTSLLFTPRPAALMLRRAFASGGEKTARGLEAHAPMDVDSLIDEPYGDEPDMLLDVHLPSSADVALPAFVWLHGGGFVGGSKDELAAYFELIASSGYAVVAPNYSLAPEHRYPTPTRQVMEALRYVQANAERLGIDPTRFALGGDSAGAQIAAQIGSLVTTPGYAEAVGIEPALTRAQLRSLVLACGPYDLALAGKAGTPEGRRFLATVLWAYSGKRRFANDPSFATVSVVDHVTSAFPPALITVGNADPLRQHSEVLVERLRERGVEPEALFFADDHEPPLGHEYQFDLDTAAGRLFLERVLAFLGQRLQ
jgi:acetyl esterase/lipase